MMRFIFRAFALGLLCSFGFGIVFADDQQPAASELQLFLGDLHSISTKNLTRVAIGDPEIADVSVISPKEVLLKAKKVGNTTLVLWDDQQKSQMDVRIVDRSPDEIIQQVRNVLVQLNYSRAEVKQEGKKIYIVGEVPSDADHGRIEQMMTMFPGLVDLTRVTPPEQPPAPTPLLIRLSVQMIEINRLDLEKLGVKWSESLALGEPAREDVTLKGAFFKMGTSLTRSSLQATLNALVRNNHARLLAEPKLVTTSGKPAESFLGTQIPILSASTTGTTGAVSNQVEFKDVGVKLKITPTVTSDNIIVSQIESEVSTIDDSTAITLNNVSVPGIKTRQTKTEIVTASGETIVVAGLVQSEDSRVVDQVPALGNMPVLGRLFRSPQFQKKETELVITVTPELMQEAGKTEEKDLALERALSSAEVVGSVEDPKLRYALVIQDRIAKNLRYPEREKELGLEGRVNVRVHIFSDGTLGKVMIAQSSGIEALDAEALKVAETQAPYPLFPSELSGKDIWLDIPVIFRP